MRLVAFTCVLAVCALHCAQTTEGSFEEGPDPPPAPTTASAAVPSSPAHHPYAHATPATAADGVVTDALRDTLDGSVYGTGTFHGEIAIGGTLLSSKGEDDVFVARRDAAGAVVWALSIGSADEESAPHLALSNGHVSVIAMTTGNVDCGSGALPNYPGTGTFVMCAFDTATGVLVESGAFPVRSP